MAHDLIDSTEMYLRTVLELEEEGIPALRARLSERLKLSPPSISEGVARLEAQGLLYLAEDRTVRFTPEGRERATHVMRKHRLAERLLVDIIGLPWEDVHVEACRWEHVISEAVEERLIGLLKAPWTCAHGNPIPGLDELGVEDYSPEPFADSSIVPIPEVVAETPTTVTVRRISEQIQSDTDVMLALKRAGVQPDKEVTLFASDDGVRVIGGSHEDGESIELSRQVASHIFVTRV